MEIDSRNPLAVLFAWLAAAAALVAPIVWAPLAVVCLALWSHPGAWGDAAAAAAPRNYASLVDMAVMSLVVTAPWPLFAWAYHQSRRGATWKWIAAFAAVPPALSLAAMTFGLLAPIFARVH